MWTRHAAIARIGGACGSPTRASPPVVEIITNVGVAAVGIVAQALVEVERVIELRDLGARIPDRRRVVRSGSRRLPDQGRSWQRALRGNRRNEAGAAVRDVDVALGLLGGLRPPLN